MPTMREQFDRPLPGFLLVHVLVDLQHFRHLVAHA